MTKSLKDISWQVSEDVYRKDPALSYSTLSKFDRVGFNGLSSLFDKVETPSLTFGSAVDSIITGGEEEFNERFLVAEFPNIPDSRIAIVKELFKRYHVMYSSLLDISTMDIIQVCSMFNFQNNWKPETRAKVIKEEGESYYKLLYLAKNKTILSTKDYQDVCNAVQALRCSNATKWYFQKDNPFEDIERLYQLKFKATLKDIDYRCMADLIICNHEEKKIIPVDLKTSSKNEWDFYKSFIDWNYHEQARLYWRIIRDNLDKDSYFKDFELLDYRFIVINKNSLIPLVWEYKDTQKEGTLYYGKDNHIVCKDPYDLGKELKEYLDYEYNVPVGIETEQTNDIIEWLNK